MMMQDLLEALTAVPGVRGALVVSREDGLVVSGALQSGVNGAAVAALSASLARRIDSLTRAIGQSGPPLFELGGSEGTLLVAPAAAGLLLVAVTAREADRAAIQEQLLRRAGEVG
jgi:predicted regulator of Ras-like GTPase activity (Roadblock/LC7/MglB family)